MKIIDMAFEGFILAFKCCEWLLTKVLWLCIVGKR